MYRHSLRDNPDLCRECYVDSALLPPLGFGACQAPKSLLQVQPPLEQEKASQPPCVPTLRTQSLSRSSGLLSFLYPSLLLLQETGIDQMGRPTGLHAPFSLQDLRQIKADLGKLSENPDKYVEVLKGLPQSFELAWKDEMLLLTQTLTSTEMTAALRAAVKYADQVYEMNMNRNSRTGEIQVQIENQCPTGRQAIPQDDPQWDPNCPLGDWRRRHFLSCVLQRL